MNVKWQKIINLYKDQNNHYWDYELEQYEILNNLFKNVETVKCIGGGPNLDFFIAQYGNNVKECVNIDKDLFYRNFNTLSLQDQYKDLFSYKGNYDFICTDAKNIPVFDKPYDCVIDNGSEVTPVPFKVKFEVIVAISFYLISCFTFRSSRRF